MIVEIVLSVLLGLVSMILMRVKYAECCGAKCQTRDSDQPNLSARIKSAILKLTPRRTPRREKKAETKSEENGIEIIEETK